MELLRIAIFTWLVVVVSAFPQPGLEAYQEQIELITQQSATEAHVTANTKATATSHAATQIPKKSPSHQTINKSRVQENKSNNGIIMAADNLSATPHVEVLSHAENGQLFTMNSFPHKIKQMSGENKRISRALDNDYFVFAVADVDLEQNGTTALRLKEFHIIATDATAVNGMVLGRNVDNSSTEVDPEDVEGRMIKMHKLKKYVRRLMRMIRKGTRKVTKATFFRSATPHEDDSAPDQPST